MLISINASELIDSATSNVSGILIVIVLSNNNGIAFIVGDIYYNHIK